MYLTCTLSKCNNASGTYDGYFKRQHGFYQDLWYCVEHKALVPDGFSRHNAGFEICSSIICRETGGDWKFTGDWRCDRHDGLQEQSYPIRAQEYFVDAMNNRDVPIAEAAMALSKQLAEERDCDVIETKIGYQFVPKARCCRCSFLVTDSGVCPLCNTITKVIPGLSDKSLRKSNEMTAPEYALSTLRPGWDKVTVGNRRSYCRGDYLIRNLGHSWQVTCSSNPLINLDYLKLIDAMRAVEEYA